MSLKNNKCIPLDKFIDLGLYDPKKGFYMRKNPIGPNGDFITAPNISVLFSEMIAIWTVAFWKSLKCPKKINLVDLGGGNGEMLKHMLSSFQNFPKFNKSCRIFLYEKSPFLKKIQKKKLKNHKVIWLKNLNKFNNHPVIFIANEFFDALPIKQFIKKNKIWHERYVNMSNKKMPQFIDKIFNINNLKSKLRINIDYKQNFVEYSPLSIIYLKKISRLINNNSGGILILDYGNFQDKMFNTLKTIKKHKFENIFENFGNSDITYDLNFNLIKKILTNLKLKISGSTTQRNFLINLGILKRAEIVSKNMLFSKKASLYFRLQRLINKNEMGEVFKVILATDKKINFNLGFK